MAQKVDLRTLSTRELAQTRNSCTLLDVRTPEEFARGHLPGSINIPLTSAFASWAARLIRSAATAPIVVIGSNSTTMQEASTELSKAGLEETVQGGWLFSSDQWVTVAQQSLASLPLASINELSELLSNKDDHQKKTLLIDVRSEEEWKQHHLSDATHIQLVDLVQASGSLVGYEGPIYVICGSGYRASTGASLLLREGFRDVRNVAGGMKAWEACHQKSSL